MKQFIVKLICEGKTSDLGLLKRRLEVLLEQDVFAPNYWGLDERKRLPWDLEDILTYCLHERELHPDFVRARIDLWSSKAPRYVGDIYVSDASVNAFQVEFSLPSSTKSLHRIYDEADAMATEFNVVFGYVHPLSPEKSSDAEGLNSIERANLFWGLRSDESGIRERGLEAVLARTWFGPALVDRVGRERLHSAGIAKEYPSGMVRVDLVREPWNASLTELAARKAEAMRVLQPSGMFVEVEFEDKGGPYAERTKENPAPKWVRPDWIISRRDVNRERDEGKEKRS